MPRFCLTVAFALFIGVALSAQSVAPGPTAPQSGPDLSGRWTRETGSGGAGSTATGGWGSQVEIKQSGSDVTAQPASGKSQRFRLDGLETAEVAAVEDCITVVRISKSQVASDRVTITTWLVRAGSAACIHGKAVDCDALEKFRTEIAANPNLVRGARKLESITVVSRDGDTMTIDSTRSVPGEVPVSTTTTYRK